MTEFEHLMLLACFSVSIGTTIGNLIGFLVGRTAAGLWAPVFPKYVLLLPGDAADPLVMALAADKLPHRALPIDAPLRTNITLVDRQGVTTKINEPGPVLGAATLAQLEQLITEQLAFELRERPGCRLAVHLLIPGWTFTGINAVDPSAAKPAGAWYPDEVIDFMLDAVDKGDFYILCPDNETPRRLDEKRMAWAMGDIIHDRPALSRWHPDFKDEFARFVKE